LTGLILLAALIFQSKLNSKQFLAVIVIGSVLVVFTMIIAIYVHLQPNVPANVLPLGIKPP
jgi:cytosine/uracil/thiamine/allantoin permease